MLTLLDGSFTRRTSSLSGLLVLDPWAWILNLFLNITDPAKHDSAQKFALPLLPTEAVNTILRTLGHSEKKVFIVEARLWHLEMHIPSLVENAINLHIWNR